MHIDFRKQITQQDAEIFGKSGAWKQLTDAEVVEVGLSQDLLCIPADHLLTCARRYFQQDLTWKGLQLGRASLLKELRAREQILHGTDSND